MRKKLSAIGNSLGVVIEKPILELLNIGRETELEVTTDGNRLVFEPVRNNNNNNNKREKIKKAHAKVMGVHAETFRKLAK